MQNLEVKIYVIQAKTIMYAEASNINFEVSTADKKTDKFVLCNTVESH